MRAPARLLAAAAAAGVGATAYGALVERRWYALRHVQVPALRPGTDESLRVLHLSDLHLAPWQVDKQRFVRRCLDLEPDLVVVTGDVLGHPAAVDPAVDLLAPFASHCDALVVLGSNDRYAPALKNPLRYFTGPSRPGRGRPLDTDRFVRGLQRAGWQVLENRVAEVDTTVGRIAVAGLGDPHIREDDPSHLPRPRSDEASSDGVALRLGVVHSPYRRALEAFAALRADLVLAGHTHGGQVRLPVAGALVTNCDLPRRQARGLSRQGDLWLHVSAGLGTSIYAPVRLACRPEATLLHLTVGERDDPTVTHLHAPAQRARRG